MSTDNTPNGQRLIELEQAFAHATLDNAQDCIEWLVHVQDFCGLDEPLDSVLARLECHTGQALYIRSAEQAGKSPKLASGLPQQNQVESIGKLAKPFDRIFAMFEKAKAAGLDWPKIVLGGGLQLTLSMNAKGIINLTNGARYGTPSNVWYGRISPPNGTVKANLDLRMNQPDIDREIITNMLKDFDIDPATVAKVYGHMTGTCMFCARKLTNPVSVNVGYGPICAETFGLPHIFPAKSTMVEFEVPTDSLGNDDDIPF